MAEHLTVTPSGFEIVFEDGEPDPQTGKGKRRCYLVNGDKLVSVTTVLGCLDKPGLQWAAEKLTVEGCIELARNGGLPQDPERALGRLGQMKLRFRQVWDEKAKRGTLSHEDLLAVTTGGEIRDLASYSPEEQGFIRGVSAFAADWRPEVTDQELMVASPEHGYAGRLDMRARTHRMPGLGLFDLKTTERLPRYKSGEVKPPYPEHLAQLAGYEIAARESGYGPSDYQAVVRVDAEGSYDVTVSWADESTFLAFLGAYRALRGLSQKPKVVAA